MNVLCIQWGLAGGYTRFPGLCELLEFLKSSIYNRFFLRNCSFLVLWPYTGSDWYQPKHSTGTICTYLGFFPFVAPSFLGQSQLPWSWFLGSHFSVSHFPSLVIVWELPAEWEARQVLPSLIFPFCGGPALHCLLFYVWKQLLPILGPIFQLFLYDIVPNWPTMSWQKVKFSLAYVFETFGH